ncbi:hypothetical protein FIU94_18405 (plasmid) [Sulfitobacter sp. THAF37]|uniref:hypothetical protein n=1 Tax=Sulfitobacter sp. THAF37 TaxID=2587855 RepID=UPI0012695E2E|nr:hypothetical protein [Sulfitobacter sp. THAF37]QFT60811.1 hypothetical protein FIU94_18405 [Sulfitobacter sp. THAF37]
MPSISPMHPEGISLPSAAQVQSISADDIGRTAIRLVILCMLVAMAGMSWTRNVNWDEFYFLSHVHANLDGRLDRPLQTVFVHAFGWLADVSGNEVDQIAIARLVMLGFFVASCLALHRIAVTLAGERSADIAVLGFVTSGFAIAHGSSFRADPMAAGLLMCALAFMMTTRMGLLHILVSAVLCALALLVTVKSALYLPVFVGALVWRRTDPGIVLRCLAAALLALAIAAVGFFWHASGITPAEGADTTTNLGDAARISIGGSGLLPRWPEASLWLMFSLGAVLLICAGFLRAPGARLKVVLWCFAVPVLSVVVYRNAFPYFFPFAVPPLMVAVAVGARAVKGGLIRKLALVLMIASGLIQTQRALAERNADQHATIAEVHRLFPEPVTYIDQNGMIASFDRQGFFMSTWGIVTYRAAGKPVFADLIADNRPPLLLTNRAELYAALRPEQGDRRLLGLLAEDARTLRQSYVHHAGVIWLAGQDVTIENGRATAEMPFAGTYRVEADTPVMIGTTEVSRGDVVTLGGGGTEIRGPEGAKVRLIWNTAPGAAQISLPETGLYAGFWRL